MGKDDIQPSGRVLSDTRKVSKIILKHQKLNICRIIRHDKIHPTGRTWSAVHPTIFSVLDSLPTYNIYIK
jgi:hypothetical protein